jgi:hypothetical protein
MTKKEREQQRLRAEFDERVERQREERQQQEQSHRSDDGDETPAPPRRFERFGTTFQATTVSMSGSDPGLDRVLAERFGARIPSAEMVREAEDRLHKRLSGERDDNDKVPLNERPDPVETPVCPIDAVPLQVVSYSASGKPATRQCPVCKRTEREMIEKGVDLRPITESIRRSMEHGGLRKKPAYSPVEQAVRSLIRKW